MCKKVSKSVFLVFLVFFLSLVLSFSKMRNFCNDVIGIEYGELSGMCVLLCQHAVVVVRFFQALFFKVMQFCTCYYCDAIKVQYIKVQCFF